MSVSAVGRQALPPKPSVSHRCWRHSLPPTALFYVEKPFRRPHLALFDCRAVAQLGSALEWGSRGRGFKSRRPERDLAIRAIFRA
jgi:hypothetical protein